MELKVFVGLIFAFSVCSIAAEKARFDNYRVYSVAVETEEQLKVLKEIEETSDSYSFWESPSKVPSIADLIVPPHKFADFSELVKNFELKTMLSIENLQNSIDNEQPKKQRKDDGVMDWEDYHSLDTIYQWLDTLKAAFPDYITVETIGSSYENREIKLVKLSKKANNRAIVIEANIHAREWIASATVTWILNEFLYSSDPEVQDLATNVDWYIIPVTNPDGYEYTRNDNRNWRKTRSKVSSVCYGVDANRNFGFNWLTPSEDGQLGASKIPCSDTFAGATPFSESEAVAVENYLIANKDKFDVYLSFHSYAHQILFPLGNSFQRIPDYDLNMAVAEAAATRLKEKYGTEYEYGNSLEVLYATSGTSVDHAYGEHGIKIVYTYEMRGSGTYGNYGFFLPPEFIVPNAEEVLDSLKGLVTKAREFGYLPVNA